MSDGYRLFPREHQARDLLLEALHEHEDRDHGGRRCDRERLGVFAWIGHCLGIDWRNDAEMERLKIQLRMLEAHHHEHHQ